MLKYETSKADIIAEAARHGITLAERDIVDGTYGAVVHLGWTIDGIPWREWLDAVAER